VGEGGFMSGLLLCGIFFIIRSNMGLCVSFICSFCIPRLYVWKRSDVFSTGPLFQCVICSLFSVLYHVCVVCLVYVVQIWSLVCWP
jgi:hypothetical protein